MFLWCTISTIYTPKKREDKMNKFPVFLCAVLLVFGVVGIANATLADNLDGTITQIRDDPTYGDGSSLM